MGLKPTHRRNAKGVPDIYRRISKRALCVAALLIAAPVLHAQQDEKRFHEYPETIGQPETFELKSLPQWLSFDGELRGRLEGQSALSDKQGESAVYGLTRIRGGMRIAPDSHASLYLQFHDNHALGLPLSQTASNMRDTFDLRQGYLDLHAGKVDLIAGRQELKFGSERLIGISDFTNNARSFDGFDLRIGDKNRVDLFTSSVVVVHPTSLDTHGKGLTFHGAYGTLTTVVPHFSLQPFLLAVTNSKVTDGNGVTGSEAEFTFGGEVSGRLAKRIDLDGMLAIQRGTYSAQSIGAAAGFVKAAYILPKTVWDSRIGVEYDRATGNDPSDTHTRRTFDQQYPSNHDAFGLVDLFGFQNIEQRRINIDIAPSKPVSFLLQGGNLNLSTPKDSVYASSGSALKAAPAGGFASRKLGYEADFSMKYLIGDDLVINAGYGHLFSTSSSIANASDGYLSVTYRFRVVRK